jgi:hypothetical protein
MRHPFLLAGRFLTVSLLLALGFIASGCGDSATVNPEVALSRLTVSPGTLQPSFSAGTTQYSVDLTSSTTSVTVSAQPAVFGDTVSINGQATTSRVITLGEAGTTTPVNVVVSESDSNSRTYTILLRRAGLAGNNSLESLAVSPGTLAPTFNANELIYTVDVANTDGSVSVTPTLQDTNATMTVNGQPAISGQAQTITLNPAGQSTAIRVIVTAQNGTPKTYLVTVSRGVSANNNLQSLTVSPGTLTPAFSAGTTDYTVNVASSVTSVTVTPRLQDTTGTMTVNGQATNSGQARTVTLNGAGSNTLINILVTAQNGTQKTYLVSVIRAALGGNNNLQSLAVSSGSLAPAFNANTTSYSVDVASDVSSVTVTPRLQDTAATMTVNGQATNSGQTRTIALNGAGSNTLITIVVTAQNSSQKTYTVNIRRAALGGNTNLQSLTVSPGTLSPAFTAARTAYTVGVGSSDTAITVTATPQDSSASVTINGQGPSSRSIPLPGGPSSTEIEVRVIAPNGTDKTYLITVNQPAPAAPAAPTVAPDLLTEDDSCPLLEPPDPTNPDPDGCVPGTSKSDNITNVNTPRFRIAPPAAGQTPNLYVGGTSVDSTFNQSANTIQPTTALSDGEHQISYTVTNAGGESGPSPSLTVTISTQAPGAPSP